MTNYFASFFAALALLVPASAESPTPGTLETYKDWTVGCDNTLRCTAISLAHDEGGGFDKRLITIEIVRDAGPAGQPIVHIYRQGGIAGEVDLLVDGRRISRVGASGSSLSVGGPRGSALAIALAQGTRLTVQQAGNVLGEASLNGSAAALRYMDARQGRAGTVTALVATGPLRAGVVPGSPALPQMTRASSARPRAIAPLTPDELAAARKRTGCDFDSSVESADLYPLDNRQILLLLSCGAGAYNASTVPLLVSGRTGHRQFRFPRFDFRPGWSGNGEAQPMVVNARWDASSATLSSYAKGRGIGDCGGAETFQWDGEAFHLLQASSMSECRGAMRWITTWRAQAVR